MTAFYTERLSHRLLEEQDIAFAASLYQDPKVMRKIATSFSKEKSERSMMAAVKAHNGSVLKLCVWLISERTTGRPVGIQMLNWKTPGSKSAEAGIMLHPSANGKQFAFEAVGAMLDVGFHIYHLDHIYAQFNTTNIPVAKFVKKLGFTTLVPSKKDSPSDCSIYRDDWQRLVQPSLTLEA